MAERLPDRMTVKLQVLQRFQELGQTPSPQQVIQATDETMAEIRRQHLRSLPPGVAQYEMEGRCCWVLKKNDTYSRYYGS